MDIESHDNGAPCWVALSAEDPAAAAQFYGALFGWQAPAWSTGAGAHEVWRLRGLPVAGIGPRRGSSGIREKCYAKPRFPSVMRSKW
jgi:hypothetical protein